LKKLGVIGGLGPIASSYFYELIVQMTEAGYDQDHLDVFIYSKPSIPDRTEYILGRSKENPAIPMIQVGKALVELGADYIAIPCITAHYFYDMLSESIGVPIVHITKETARYLRANGVLSAGLMATEGTVNSRLFQMELEKLGIKTVLLSRHKQDFVTEVIYENIKAGKPPNMHKFYAVYDELKGLGAEVIILGCTELSLIKREQKIGSGFIDAMEVLARRSILLCEAKLKEKYQKLIT
jgi:aspartate racemase